MPQNKFILIVFLLGCVSLVSCQKKVVSIPFTYFQPYCGGARPSPQMIEDAQKPKPYSEKMIIVMSANGKVDSVKTSAEGLAKVKLKPGTYRVFEAWRYYKTAPEGSVNSYDPECLKKEWQKECYLVTVTKKSTEVKEVNSIINYCSWKKPCLKEENKILPE